MADTAALNLGTDPRSRVSSDTPTSNWCTNCTTHAGPAPCQVRRFRRATSVRPRGSDRQRRARLSPSPSAHHHPNSFLPPHAVVCAGPSPFVSATTGSSPLANLLPSAISPLHFCVPLRPLAALPHCACVPFSMALPSGASFFPRPCFNFPSSVSCVLSLRGITCLIVKFI